MKRPLYMSVTLISLIKIIIYAYFVSDVLFLKLCIKQNMLL